MKFLSIVSSNLDEFFMVRVAALKQKLAAGSDDLSIDGKNRHRADWTAVRTSVDQLTLQIYDCFQSQLLPALRDDGIVIADYSALDDRERDAVDRYYARNHFPRAHAARVRSRPPVPAHFESQPESRHRPARSAPRKTAKRSR